VGHDPLQHIGRALLPAEARVGVVKRIENGLDDARLPPRQHAFADQRLEPFHDDRADHFDRRSGADRAFVDPCRHVERGERLRRGFDMRAADQERGSMQARMNRRHHRDVEVASARRGHVRSRAGLGLGRARIAVEEQRALRQSRQRRQRRLVRLIGGNDGDHRLSAGGRVGRARSADDVRRNVVRSLRRPHLWVGRIGLGVVGGYARLEAFIRAPAVEKGARRLPESEKRDRACGD